MSRFASFALAAACAVMPLSLAHAANDAPFPRIASINYGGSPNYEDPAYQAKLAKVDLTFLTIWPGWEKGRATTMEQVVKNIKAKNPNTKVFLYIVNNEMTDGTNNDNALAPWRQKINAEKWWLYPSVLSGTRVTSTWSPNHYIVNNTPFGKKDANGDRAIEWYAKFVVNNYYKPNPSIDGFMTDNVFWKPRVNGDWNRDGKIDSKTDPTAQLWMRQGFRQHFNMLNTLMPGKMQTGNVADWGAAEASLTELTGVLQGGLFEWMIGQSYSIEKSNGWATMMQWYRKMMGALKDPKLGVFHQAGSPTDYQAFRYGFASSLMDDGYYAFTDLSKGYKDVIWFDEMDTKLGKAISAPSKTAWQKGVYRRDFTNGIALVNPKGNGEVTVTLEGDFKRVTGKQAPTVNSGATTKTVTLKDRDGIILLRLKPKTAPRAPGSVGVTIQ